MTKLSRDEITRELEPLLSRLADKKLSVSEATAIYHDLWIGGDDAGELLDAIHSRFGTDFHGLHFDRYFPNEGEVFPEHILKLLGFRKKATWQRLTVGHLVDVIQKGAWFDPPTASTS